MPEIKGYWFKTAGLIIGAPLVGAALIGRPISPLFRFALRPEPAVHAPFSWGVFSVYAALAIGILLVLAIAARRPGHPIPALPPIHPHAFPGWGWAGVAGMVFFWIMAWSRWSWASDIQPYTFTPLWIAFIVVLNAMIARHGGRSPLIHQTRFFLLLFPVSSLFWWFFEYINQFVQNWSYAGVAFSPLAYRIHATIAFSTVLPAVYSTQRWIAGLPWFRCRFHGIAPLKTKAPKRWAWVALAGATIGLAAMPQWPGHVFSLVWVAPLVALVCLQVMAGSRHVFSEAIAGDWRPAVSWALAALICGFVWEMWNFFSLARWSYAVPYVQRFHIFEMPVVGYAGYLPFGLECMAVVAGVYEMTGWTTQDPIARTSVRTTR